MRRTPVWGFVETGGRSGRMGHGSGLEITEPPSVGAHDHTILRSGMVIHIEPKMILPYGFFQLEEAVVVTEGGFEYLTPPAPARLPVIGRGCGAGTLSLLAPEPTKAWTSRERR